MLSVRGPVRRPGEPTETEGGLFNQTSVLLTVKGTRSAAPQGGKGGELERGGRRGSEGLGGQLKVLLGDAQGLAMSPLGLDPFAPIGRCISKALADQRRVGVILLIL